MAAADGLFPANREGERAVDAAILRPPDNLAARIGRDGHALRRGRSSTSPPAAAMPTASPPGSPLRSRDVLASQAGALASKPAWTLPLDLGRGEVVVARRNHRATGAAPVHRQAFTSALTQ
jgi:hypothetical protein